MGFVNIPSQSRLKKRCGKRRNQRKVVFFLGVFKKINFGLRKTRNNVSGAIDNVLDSYTSIDEGLFDELEEALVMGDVGVSTASEITLRLNDRVRKKGIKNCSIRKNRKQPFLIFILKILIISNNIKSYKEYTKNCNYKI